MNDRKQYYRDYNAKRKAKMAEYDKSRRDLKREYLRLDSLANPEKYKEYRKKNYYKNKNNWTPVSREYEMFKAAKVRAKKKGLEFDIEPSDIFIPEFCPVLGIGIRKDNKTQQDDSPSLDRVDTSLGYVKGNICVISWRANNIKSFGTSEEHRKIADYIDSFSRTPS